MSAKPQPSDIQNVFAMNQPQHMFRKLFWEIDGLMKEMSVHHENDQWPDAAIFIAFNAVITAWHISDWLWQSNPENRKKLASRLKIQFDEKTSNGRRVGLERFQDRLAEECRALHVLREIANGSKHMRKNNPDPDVKAVAEWHKVVEGAGFARPGDLVMSLNVLDGDQKSDVTRLLIDAIGFWEKLFAEEALVEPGKFLPAKIIKRATPKDNASVGL